MEFAGEFETHITVRLSTESELAVLQEWCVRQAFKCTHIVLERGRHASQPMLSRRGFGVLTRELATATAASKQLQSDGFQVARTKIEGSPENDDVPVSDSDAALQPPDRYFEHHLKLQLRSGANTDALLELVQKHSAHLSRNALRMRSDGYEERFVTQRCYRVGRGCARKALQALIEDLQVATYSIVDVEAEYVVYDSDLTLDAGWLESEVPG